MTERPEGVVLGESLLRHNETSEMLRDDREIGEKSDERKGTSDMRATEEAEFPCWKAKH